MIHSLLKRSDLHVSRIGLGAAQFGMNYGFDKAKTQSEVDQLLGFCAENGLNFIDTAREYGDSEAKIGNYLKGNLIGRFVIGTKFAYIKKPDAQDKESLRQRLNASLTQSLENLGKDAVDILWLHQPESFIVENRVFWSTVEDMRKKNQFKLFGISVYDVESTRAIVDSHAEDIDCIQVPFNVFDRRFEELFELLEEKEINIIARSVFLKGVITSEESQLPDEMEGIKAYKQKLNLIASKAGMNVSELAVLFVLSFESIASLILGVSSVQELKENMNVLNIKDRIQGVREAINDLSVDDLSLIDPRQWVAL